MTGMPANTRLQIILCGETSYQVRVAELHGCLVVRFIDGEIHCFSFPVGNGDKKAAVEELLAICHEEGIRAADSTCQRAGPRADARVVPGKILNRGRPERL